MIGGGEALTGDDEFEDVIPARTSHNERVYGNSLRLGPKCQRGSCIVGVYRTPLPSPFFEPTMSTATWRQFFTYPALFSLKIYSALTIKITGTTNTPKLLLAQFASRSRRTSGWPLRGEGSPPLGTNTGKVEKVANRWRFPPFSQSLLCWTDTCGMVGASPPAS